MVSQSQRKNKKFRKRTRKINKKKTRRIKRGGCQLEQADSVLSVLKNYFRDDDILFKGNLTKTPSRSSSFTRKSLLQTYCYVMLKVPDERQPLKDYIKDYYHNNDNDKATLIKNLGLQAPEHHGQKPSTIIFIYYETKLKSVHYFAQEIDIQLLDFNRLSGDKLNEFYNSIIKINNEFAEPPPRPIPGLDTDFSKIVTYDPTSQRLKTNNFDIYGESFILKYDGSDYIFLILNLGWQVGGQVSGQEHFRQKPLTKQNKQEFLNSIPLENLKNKLLYDLEKEKAGPDNVNNINIVILWFNLEQSLKGGLYINGRIGLASTPFFQKYAVDHRLELTYNNKTYKLFPRKNYILKHIFNFWKFINSIDLKNLKAELNNKNGWFRLQADESTKKTSRTKKRLNQIAALKLKLTNLQNQNEINALNKEIQKLKVPKPSDKKPFRLRIKALEDLRNEYITDPNLNTQSFKESLQTLIEELTTESLKEYPSNVITGKKHPNHVLDIKYYNSFLDRLIEDFEDNLTDSQKEKLVPLKQKLLKSDNYLEYLKYLKILETKKSGITSTNIIKLKADLATNLYSKKITQMTHNTMKDHYDNVLKEITNESKTDSTTV